MVGRVSLFRIDDEVYKRYDWRKQLFCRTDIDPTFKHYNQEVFERMKEYLKEKKEGYERIDYALDMAAWKLYEMFKHIPREELHNLGIFHSGDNLPPYEVKDPATMSRIIKKVASFFGASLTGIARVNERWLYSHDCQGNPIDMKDYRYVIVMAIEMNPDAMGSSPSVTTAASTALGYAKLSFLTIHLAQFIRYLGYKAMESINDTGLSIPMAIEAGLGKLGRIGLLVTPQFGPRVQLCKVFTDLPLQPDNPHGSGILDTCKHCKLCALACEVDAISLDDEPSFKIQSPTNNPGVMKWYINPEKCYNFWYDNSTDCSTCIEACPYSKVKEKTPAEFWES